MEIPVSGGGGGRACPGPNFWQSEYTLEAHSLALADKWACYPIRLGLEFPLQFHLGSEFEQVVLQSLRQRRLLGDPIV